MQARSVVPKGQVALTLVVLTGLLCRHGLEAQDWPQLFGDGGNTNYSPCSVEPPLVELWRVPVSAVPVTTLAASGVVAMDLRFG